MVTLTKTQSCFSPRNRERIKASPERVGEEGSTAHPREDQQPLAKDLAGPRGFAEDWRWSADSWFTDLQCKKHRDLGKSI